MVTAKVAVSGRSKPMRRDIALILRQRERLVAELTRLRAQGRRSEFIDNALRLMTRWWSPASWSAREGLLRSAAWLVRLEMSRAKPTPEDVCYG